MSLAKILPLLIAAAPIALATPALAQSGPAAGITTQLPRGAVPSHYAIEVTPDAANLKFTGKVTIDFRPVHNYTMTNEIQYIAPKARVY